MIEMINVSKKFDTIKALDQVSVVIKEENIFGLLGTNGAGKSTFLRLLSGILKQDSGVITIDEKKVYENIKAKELFFYISDDQYFFANSAPKDIKAFYSSVYSSFDSVRFDKLLNQFELDRHRKISTYSKGMKKQLSIICAICANTKYILCDETFDGLDPVMRQAVKSIFAKEMTERKLTAIIASHNLRELEDICDCVGLLHKGGIVLSKDLYDMKISLHKIQCVFGSETDIKYLFDGMDLLKVEQRGSLFTITVRGSIEEIENRLDSVKPIFKEVIPLSLEEIFISETEVIGYDVKKLIC